MVLVPASVSAVDPQRSQCPQPQNGPLSQFANPTTTDIPDIDMVLVPASVSAVDPQLSQCPQPQQRAVKSAFSNYVRVIAIALHIGILRDCRFHFKCL